MCLGVPGRIVSVDEDAPLRLATVDFGGVRRRVSLAYLPDAGPGDFCIVHVGFALTKVDEAKAESTLAVLRELALVEELGPGDGP